MMLRKLVIFLLYSPLALAQLTTVTGTVKDPTGLPYSNGTITPTLVISGSPRFPSGFPYTPPNQPVGLDANGHFVMSLADVTQILPSGGTWSFHVCSATGTVQPGSPITNGPVCFDTVGLIISGSSQDISTPLSSAAPRLTSAAAAGLTFPIDCPSESSPCLTTTLLSGPGFGFGNIGGTPGMPAIYGVAGLVGEALAIWVNGTAVATFPSTPAANFNNSTPTAPTNGLNVQWQQVAGNPAFISAAIVGDGVATDCFLGTGIFGPCNTSTFNFASGFLGCTTSPCITSLSGAKPSAFTAKPHCVLTPSDGGQAVTSYSINDTSTSTSVLAINYSPVGPGTSLIYFICMGI